MNSAERRSLTSFFEKDGHKNSDSDNKRPRKDSSEVLSSTSSDKFRNVKVE